MKKVLFLSLLILLIIFSLQFCNKETLSHSAKKNIIKTYKNKFPRKEVSKVQIIENKVKTPKKEKLDIEKYSPCEVFEKVQNLDKDELYTLLPENKIQGYYKFKKMIPLLEKIGSKVNHKIEYLLHENLDQLSSIPHLPIILDIYQKVFDSKISPSIKDKILNSLQATLDEFSDTEYIENLIARAYFFHTFLKEDPVGIIGSINESFSPRSSYQNLTNHILQTAKSPAQIAVAISLLSSLPTLDSRFLLEMKKKHMHDKDLTKTINNMAEKVIREQHQIQHIFQLDLLNYAVMQKIHSKPALMLKKYGSYEDLIEKRNLEDIYGSGCDDRKIIQLCDRLCTQ